MDLVRLKAHPRSNVAVGFTAKLAPVYKGPYRIARVISDLNYKLTRLDDGAEGGVHHVSNRLPFLLEMKMRMIWSVCLSSWLKMMYRTE